MTSRDKRNTLGWNDYGTNFSIAFNELLQNDEMVDVALVADGHLINAHRLILSALSPSFRKMFKHMPANQKAFVFLKDVSKEAAEDLITYIYQGEVNVASECLGDFLNVAKALEIKGLNERNYSQTRKSKSPKRTWSNSAANGMQYQSTHVNQHLGHTNSLKETKPVQLCPTDSNYHQSLTDESNDEDSDYENKNEMNNDFDQKYGYATNGNNSMNQANNSAASFSQWWNKREKDSNSNQDINASIIKRPKWNDGERDSSDYRIRADVRINEDGRRNLFYDGYKFYPKQHKGSTSTRWYCTSHNKGRKCRFSILTIEIEGITMMKDGNEPHQH